MGVYYNVFKFVIKMHNVDPKWFDFMLIHGLLNGYFQDVILKLLLNKR